MALSCLQWLGPEGLLPQNLKSSEFFHTPVPSTHQTSAGLSHLCCPCLPSIHDPTFFLSLPPTHSTCLPIFQSPLLPIRSLLLNFHHPHVLCPLILLLSLTLFFRHPGRLSFMDRKEASASVSWSRSDTPSSKGCVPGLILAV